MHVQRIMATTPVSTVVKDQNTNKLNSKAQDAKVSNPFDETNSSRASQIARNYFMGSQKVNFTGFPCSTSNFKVKELEDMPCTCCGRPMMTNKQTDEFALKAGKAVGAELNQVLEDNMPYFRAEEKAIVHYIQKQTKDMPDATLTTAISRTNADPAKILKDEVGLFKGINNKVLDLLTLEVKYEGYIKRQLAQIKQAKNMEDYPLKADFNYNEVKGLRLEARQKLNDIKPLSMGQASRISGVSPADISVLLVYLKSKNGK